MNLNVYTRRLPEAAVLALLILLGPACGGGGGGGSGFSGTSPAATGGFTPSTAAPPGPFVNRTTGVAPMGVFCCAANAYQPGSTTTLIPQPSDLDFSTYQYSWDFGDPGSGTWANTGLSKNTAKGYSAAHVYQNPGTYTVSCTVTDNLGASSTFSQGITVNAFAGTTYYVSNAGGNDANDGLSPATAWKTVGKVFSNIATNRQFLFNRGETFSTPGNFIVDQVGPGLIGAYGAGAKPVITVTGTAGFCKIRQSDWTVQDLEMAGPGTADQIGAMYLEETRQMKNILWQRLTVHDFRTNLGWTDWPTMYTTPHDGNMVVECFAFNPQVNGFYLGGRHLALLGNTVQDCATSHLCRVWQAHKGVIAHNVFLRPGNDRHSLKLHGPTAGDGRPETQFVTISDNVFQGNTWVVPIGPQDAAHDERVSQVIFERNIVNSTALTQVGIVLKGRNLTVRNNIFNGTGSSQYYSAVGVGDSNFIDPPAKDLQIVNNTVYKGDGGSQFAIVSFDARGSNVTVRNNFAFGGTVSSKVTITGNVPNLTVDHNLLTASPGFVNAAGGNFRLGAGSPGIDAGVAVPQVQEDFGGTARPVGAAADLGAYEQ